MTLLASTCSSDQLNHDGRSAGLLLVVGCKAMVGPRGGLRDGDGAIVVTKGRADMAILSCARPS